MSTDDSRASAAPLTFDYEKCRSVAFALKDGPSLIHEALMAAMFDATIS